MMSNSPLASLAKQHGINFEPRGTKGMLQYASKNTGAAGGDAQPDEGAGNAGQFDLGQFRTAKQDQADKRARLEQMNQMVADGTD